MGPIPVPVSRISTIPRYLSYFSYLLTSPFLPCYTSRMPILFLLIFFISHAVLAHQAPSGWYYDLDCCGNYDCAPVPDVSVREVVGGYRVLLLPGQHPLVSRPVEGFIPHGSPNLRPSGDGLRHVCIVGGRIQCLYVPPGGV